MSFQSGTIASPPRSNRRGQYVKRSDGSCGPTIRPGPHDRTRGRRTRRAHVLAQHLQRPVRLARHLGRSRILELADRRVFVDARRRHVGVHRHARHERVVTDAVGQQLGDRSHVARDVAARVDHGVPLPRLERAEVVVAVDHEARDVGIQVGVGLAHGWPASRRGPPPARRRPGGAQERSSRRSPGAS